MRGAALVFVFGCAIGGGILLARASNVFAQERQAPPATPQIGLAVGQKAPGFALRDQFGREVSSDTLRGPKGTVILFFRSADW